MLRAAAAPVRRGGRSFARAPPRAWSGCPRVASRVSLAGCRHFGEQAAKTPPSDGAAASGEQRKAEEPNAYGPDSGQIAPGRDNVQFTWASAIFTCVVGGGCVFYYDYCRRTKEGEARACVKTERLGVPKLGGPFELLDRKGVVKTDQDYKGQYLLIYFGFTFCPDICPQEMEKQTHAVELLDKQFGPVVTPVFISIDPRRDTVAQVDEYCSEFHPRIVGLTGTQEQVKKVSRAYRVYFNEGIRTSDEDYLVDHSIIHYFMDKRGKFKEFFGKNMTAKEMAEKMATFILEDAERAKRKKSAAGVSEDEDE